MDGGTQLKDTIEEKGVRHAPNFQRMTMHIGLVKSVYTSRSTVHDSWALLMGLEYNNGTMLDAIFNKNYDPERTQKMTPGRNQLFKGGHGRLCTRLPAFTEKL